MASKRPEWLDKVHVIASFPATIKEGGRPWKRVQDELKANSIDYKLFVTSAPKDAVRLARESRAGGATLVVAAGGDGTIHEIVNGLIESSTGAGGRPAPMPVLGIIPLGRGNDYYRGLRSANFPTHAIDFEEAVKRLELGAIQTCDVGRMEYLDMDRRKLTLYFNNSVSAGFAADVTRRVAGSHSKSASSYQISLFMTLLGWHNEVADVVHDEATYKAELFSLNVAIGKFYGGGMYAAPRAKLGDGLMDVVLMDRMTKLDVIRYMPNNRNGDFENIEKVKQWRATTVDVKAPDPILIQADGEFAGSTPMHCDIVPGALRVVF